MSSSVKRGNQAKGQDKRQKYESIKAKALEIIKDPENKDDLVTLVRLITADKEQYIVSIGKCSGRVRAFPCVVIDNGVRQYTFSTSQVNALVKAINAMSDESYDALIGYITDASTTRVRPRRPIKDEGEVETEALNNEANEDTEEQ